MIFRSQSWKSLTNLSEYTKLLIHSNSTDASTTFTDASASGHTVTAGGDAQHDTAQYKFGPTSILFDGTGDYLAIPDHANFNLADDSFTIDFWVRFNALSTTGLVYQYSATESGFYLQFNAVASTLNFQNIVSGTGSTIISKDWSPSTDTWYHVAIVRNANTWTLYVNGNSIGTETDTTTLANSTRDLWVGYLLNGWIDEFRLVKGKAMWTTQFVPPKGRYT